MIYGFAYLVMVLAISAGWIIIAVLKKPDFIEKPYNELMSKIRPFLNPKDDQWNLCFLEKGQKQYVGIGLIAIGISSISKKVISYPAGGCMKDTQKLTLNKEINKFFI